jgi:molybdopterin/thiamine biosynthesis adenylyltransferase
VSIAIEHDRLAHLIMGRDAGIEYDDARMRLDRAALVLTTGESANTAWSQAALLTIAECGVRMFQGGVYLGQPFEHPTVVGHRPRAPLYRYLREAGCRIEEAPAHAVKLHVGTDGLHDRRGLRCWADGWTAVVSPKPDEQQGRPGNEISGVLAGALGVTELFRSSVLDDIRAGRRTQRLSALAPGDGSVGELELEYLPSEVWILGLGNLGQATLWTLGLLPYEDTDAVTLLLQDPDTTEVDNLQVQILSRPSWIGQKKTRSTAAWAEVLGFRTRIVEQRFGDLSKRAATEPGLAFVGVDNLLTRQAATNANFDLLIDAGLGASAVEVFDMRLHAFPGSRTIAKAWPEIDVTAEPSLSPALLQLIADGRIDKCGALTIAGRSLGIPSTAVAAASIQVAQACRAIAQSRYCDLVDVSLVDCRRIAFHEFSLGRTGSLPFVRSSRKT